jgi:hypothetical protein
VSKCETAEGLGRRRIFADFAVRLQECAPTALSIPFTAAPATFLSTSLSVSFATSTADFCERTEVEKVALELDGQHGKQRWRFYTRTT